MRCQSGGGHPAHDRDVIKLNVDFRGLATLGRMSGGYFATTFVNNAIPFLVLPLLTRYLSPPQYGHVALFSFYLALCNALTGVSLPTVISKNFYSSGKPHVARLIGNSLLIALAFSSTTMVFILAAHPFLRRYFELELFWLLLIPLTSLAFIVFSMGLTVMRNEKKGSLFGRHQIGNTAMNITVSLLLIAVFLWGWQGRVWGIIISYFISALLMFAYLKSNGYISFAISKEFLHGILKVALPLIPNSFQSVVISQVGLFFMQLYFSAELLGVYAVGFQVAFAIKLLGVALALSWTPYLYEQLARPNSINRIFLSRMLIALAAVMTMGVVFINVFSVFILKLMTSHSYYGSQKFIPWFSIGFFFNGLYVFVLPMLIQHDRQRFISIISFSNMLIMIMLNIWLVDAFGYMGSAYAFAIVYLLMFLAFAWKAQVVFPLPWMRALKVWG